MNTKVLAILITGLWMGPLMGKTMKLNIMNATDKEALLSVNGSQKKAVKSVKIAPHHKNTIMTNSNQTSLAATLSSIVPSRQQLTPIEAYKDSRGWLFVGLDAQKNRILTPLLPLKSKFSVSKGATGSYKEIKGMIMGVEEFPELINEADIHKETLQAAAYAKTIQPNSYVVITPKSSEDAHLTMHLYDFRVAQSAAIKAKKKK